MNERPHPASPSRAAMYHNLFHTALILLSMGLLFGALGWMIFGVIGLILSVMMAVLVLASTPKLNPPMILKMYGARPLSFREAPGMYSVVSELSRRAGLKNAPVLYYVPSRVMNAFSLGSKENSAIALSDRLIRFLSFREMAGVLAHEMSHISNNDLRLHALADMMTRITSLLSFIGQLLILLYLPVLFFSNERIPVFFIALLIFAPTVSMLLQLALSRNREFVADATAVSLTGDPEGLASALAKMDTYEKRFWEVLVLPGKKAPDPSALRTHPKTRERIRRIMLLEPGQGPPFPDLDPGPPGRFSDMRGAPPWNWFQPWR
ncbi:MAG TPA: zinc metalloprotease HtpX [Deltaproteobacteria bacterium]|nr:zinc metalloprotease HtpX [Deltaproteobacteria bacterium]